MQQNFKSKPTNLYRAAMLVTGITVFAALPAAAFTNEGVRLSPSVKIDPSDLQTSDGVERVYAKLKKTAVKACKNRNRKTTDREKATRICEAQILSDFVAGVQNSDLTTYHKAQQDT